MTLSLLACAQKDPLAGRAKGNVAPPPQTAPQEYDECTMNITGPAFLYAVEGRSVTVPFYIRGLHGRQTDEILTDSKVEGLTIRRYGMTKDGLKFNFTFSPPKGSVQNGSNSIAHEINLLPKSQLQNEVRCTRQLGLFITRTDQVPVIKPVFLNKKLNLNATEKVRFNVDVMAKDVINIENLQLYGRYDKSISSKENPVYSMTPAVSTISGPTAVGNSTYRFTLEINPEIIRYLLAEQLKSSTTNFEFTMQLSAENRDANLSSPTVYVTTTFTRPKPEDQAQKSKIPTVANLKETKP